MDTHAEFFIVAKSESFGVCENRKRGKKIDFARVCVCVLNTITHKNYNNNIIKEKAQK